MGLRVLKPKKRVLKPKKAAKKYIKSDLHRIFYKDGKISFATVLTYHNSMKSVESIKSFAKVVHDALSNPNEKVAWADGTSGRRKIRMALCGQEAPDAELKTIKKFSIVGAPKPVLRKLMVDSLTAEAIVKHIVSE